MSLTVKSGTDLSNLFSSLSNGKNNNAGSIMSGMPLADYASIKNGSYSKLAKAYYKKTDRADKADDAEKTSDKNEVSKESSKNTLAAAATNLKSAASALKDTKSLYEKKTVKDSDGNETTDYDWDTLSKKVSNFVKGYNSTLSKLGASTDTSYSSAYLTMAKKTASVSGILSKVGITMEEDGALAFDADAFKKSDINTVKRLFSGAGSYSDMIGSTAAAVENRAANANSTYASSGNYSAMSTSSMIDSYL